MFLLGPSHHVYLNTCALSRLDFYQTPLGKLRLDKETIARLSATNKFKSMSVGTDEDEHSLELHLPYIYKVFEDNFKSEEDFPPLIPILVGNTSPKAERDFGALLADYLEDPGSLFVISSDFAHWGKRFRYTRYLPELEHLDTAIDLDGYGAYHPTGNDPAIYESIARLDRTVMDSIEVGDHINYWQALESTGNTVCGRHPIGIMLAAVQVLVDRRRLNSLESSFHFIQYTRSSDCRTVQDSSVSYASAFAMVRCGDIEAELAAEEGQFRGYNSETMLDKLTGRKPVSDDSDDSSEASVDSGDVDLPVWRTIDGLTEQASDKSGTKSDKLKTLVAG